MAICIVFKAHTTIVLTFESALVSKAMNTKDLESWLQKILIKENLIKIRINSSKTISKGNNYLGDIFFIDATIEFKNGHKKTQNIVLKSSKKSEQLREIARINLVFLNEIFLYQSVLPYLAKFQSFLGIREAFDNFPKCYGCFVDENTEVIGLEDLKAQDYYLWDKKIPMPKNYLNLVLETYGKLHATSAAIASQNPHNFQELCNNSDKILSQWRGRKNRFNMFTNGIEEVYNLIKNDVDKATAEKWLSLKEKVEPTIQYFKENSNYFKVFVHGDCWNNNFMFKSEKNDKRCPSRIVILDWQMSKVSSPIADLAYFLFTCISCEDMQEIGTFLNAYYHSFDTHLSKLGSNSKNIYSREQFFLDWKNYCIFGAFFCPFILKLCVSEEDEPPNVIELLENGKEFSDMFIFDIKDVGNYRKRIQPVIDYLIKNNII